MLMRHLIHRFIIVAAVMTALAGCDDPPKPTRFMFFTIDAVDVNKADAEEYALVNKLVVAQDEYSRNLATLYHFYERHDDLAMMNWVRKEHANLTQAQIFQWVGAEPAPPVESSAPEEITESLLVERVVAAREVYVQAVRDVAAFYAKHGPKDNAKASHNILERFDPIRTYYYLEEAEFPPATLQPGEPNPEADAIFADALELHEKGKGWLRTFVTTNYPHQRKALKGFQQVIAEYPTSDKIPEAAFHIGEIYKEYFNEDVRAVEWYQLARTWDDGIQLPARFQAATVYDLRLNNKAKALALYQETLEKETFNQSNVAFAGQRILEIRHEAEGFQSELDTAPGPAVNQVPTPEPIEPPLPDEMPVEEGEAYE